MTKPYMGQIMAECDCQHAGCEDRGYCMADRIATLTEQLEAARRDAKEAEACLVEGWQPIETAPKDGTEIILGWDIASVWIVRSGWWEDGFDMIEGGYDEECEGWWSYRHSVTQEKLDGYDNPTHWMPLPKPPKESL